jgi:ribosomal protein L18
VTTLPGEASSASSKPRSAFSSSWAGFIVCLVTGFVAGVLIVDGRTRPLANRVSAVEAQVKGFSADVEAAKVDAAVAKAAMYADRYLALGTPNAYQDLGPFWQVHGLQLVSDPQGCRVSGEILYRLMVRRQNVDVSATLITSSNTATAVGASVLAVATPGKYERFSIPVRTGAKLSEIGQVYLRVNERSGTAGALY